MVYVCSERNNNESLCFSNNIIYLYTLVDRLLSYDATYVASLLSKPTLLYCTLQHHGTQEGGMRRTTYTKTYLISYVTSIRYTAPTVILHTGGWTRATCIVNYNI